MGKRDIEFSIPLPIVVQLALCIGNQYGGAASDTVDRSDVRGAFKAETNSGSDSNVKLSLCPLLLGNQIVLVLGMTKEAAGDTLKTRRSTTTVIPDQHLNQVDQFMLHDPLQSLQAIAAHESGDAYWTLEVIECLKQKWG